MLRGTLTCGRGGAVQTRLLYPWPPLVCTLRTLHKTGVLHPCLSPLGPGSCSRKHLAGVRGRSALWRHGVLCTEACLVTMDPLGWEWAAPQEGIFSCHHFFPSCVSRNGIKAPLCQLQPQDHRPPSLFPRDHQSAVLCPLHRWGPLSPASQRFCFWPVSGKVGSRGRPALQGTGGWHFPGWPQPEVGGPCCSFWLLQEALSCCHPQGSSAAQAGSWASHEVGASSWPRGRCAAPHSAPHPSPGGRGWGAFCDVSSPPALAGSSSV